jgi:uncharacterized repeat protein (TIGR01451 family)
MPQRRLLIGAFLSILILALATDAGALRRIIPPSSGGSGGGSGSTSPIAELGLMVDEPVLMPGSSATISFTVSDSNSGDAAADDTTLTVTLPTDDGLSWSGPTSCSSTSNGVFTCALGSINLGATSEVDFTTTVPSTLSCGGTESYSVSASADDASATSYNGTMQVDCPTTLSLAKSADQASVTSGNAISFSIELTNSGNQSASNTSLTDSLPATGAAWTVNSDSTGTCTISGQTLSCPIGALAASNTATIDVGSTPTTCGQYTNTAMASADNASSVASNSASATVLCSGLNVVTTPDDSPINADDIAGFTTTVSLSSDAPATATDVTISQPLAAEEGLWSIDPTSQAAASCQLSGAAGSQILSCTFSSLAAGASETVHFTASTNSSDCISNPPSTTATAAANNYVSATSTANVTVQCPILTLGKTADAASVDAGSNIGFTLTAGNTGPGTAYNATLSDNLPQLPLQSWTINPSVSGCAVTSNATGQQSLTCDAGTLAPNDSISVHVQSTTDATYCATWSNSASVSADNSTSSPTASASTTVNCPALQIGKTADNATVSGGDQIGYTIGVLNSGAGDAEGVTITDTLPTNSGLNWTAPSGCSISSGVLTCSLGTVTANSSASVHITSSTGQTTCGTVSNSAGVSSTNSAAVAPTSVAAISVNCPMLSLTNVADTSSVDAGGSIGYTITATNSGAGTAEGVTLSENLPDEPGLDWTISPAYTGPGTCTVSGSNPQVLTCTIGNLTTSASAMVHVTSTTGDNSCGAESPTASLSASNANTLTQGASSTVLCPQLQVTKTPTSSTASANDTIGFGITVSNGGNGAAEGVMLTDTLPTAPGLNWSITSQNPTDCSIASGTLSCNVGTLNAGATATVNISSPTTPATCGTVSNTAAATTTNGTGAESSTSITVGCPNLMITKTAASNPVNAGQNAVFNISVNNLGNGIARAATLTDQLPAGFTWSNNNTACSISSSGLMTCDFGDMLAGQTQTVQLTAPTPARLCAPISNSASVTATNETTANLNNDSSSATININCQADLAILKLPVFGTVKPGALQIYLIAATDTGPHPAQNVVINDPLPAGTVFASLIATGSCSKPAAGATGSISCTVGTLPVGATWLGLLTVKVTAPAKSTVINKATVTGTTVDPNPGNNSSTASTPVS